CPHASPPFPSTTLFRSDMTGSATALGLVQACRAAPLLIFGLWAGVAADRYDRKRQLILAQNANAVLNVILAALIITGRVEPWHRSEEHTSELQSRVDLV